MNIFIFFKIKQIFFNSIKYKIPHYILFGTMGFGAFLVYYSLTLRFESLEVFDQYNVLFDSDPNTRLSAFSHGWGDGRSFAHPNLSNFFNPPIRILGKIIYWWGATNLSELEIRQSIGLLIVPGFSGAGIFFACLLFSILGFTTLQTILIGILCTVAFSQIIFCSIPEHFALSGLFILLMYFLATDLVKQNGKVRHWAWLLIGGISVGITITNIVAVGITFFTSHITANKNFWNTCIQSAKILILILLANLSISHSMNMIFDLELEKKVGAQKGGWIGTYFSDEPHYKLINSFYAITKTICPPGLRLVESKAPAKYDFKFTLEGVFRDKSHNSFLVFAINIAVVFGSICGIAANKHLRVIFGSALLILVFNLCFHAIWGDEYFLYSQHWFFSSIILLSGTMLPKWANPYVGNSVFALFVLFVIINNTTHINTIFSVLSMK